MATSSFIPKAELNAYQRWEMNALDAPDPTPGKKDQQLNTEDNPLPDEQDEIISPTEEEIAAVLHQAKTEGYAAGYQAGNTAGYAEGRKTAETEITTEVARLQALLSNLDQDLHKIDQHVADDLLDLAITLTKKMVTQALQLKPELIVPIVQEAIRNLPSAMQHPRLYLHPEDAKIVHAHLGDQLAQDSWSIRADEQLSKGGCRIEANGGEIDASLEVRWQRVLSAIGQNDSWLEKND